MNDEITAARMDDPRPGDRFTETHMFWVEVLFREGDLVLYWDTNPNRPDGDQPRLLTTGEFRARFAYTTIPGYWVSYYDAKGSVMPPDEARAWIERIGARRAAEAKAASMLGASL